ncbi:hypothetical protein [Nostoc sp. MS1]|uniref:cysteine dioxygenase family protein n=1 Tax=Nostoc sp. MS1 TaxID=2764711 RepID=UPI001CC58707|nr:hypothetical protein [Nostoc sp. MS1]BCL36239.1 3-mercaptopropionate dioxygenase [Nostoc sp. MS1]
MTEHGILEPLSEDQWFIDSQELRSFVATVRDISADTIDNRERTLDRLEPYFQELLAQEGWLPEKYAQINPESGMGGGIGQWLLYRSQDRSLTVFSLVIPPGAGTPVHDHLAWGLIGLYKGNQAETVYSRIDGGNLEGHAQLEVVEERSLQPGDIYRLLPPEGDIHAVKTTSASPSVSIHVLGNDTGCIWRHQFIPEAHSVKSFRSGYSNAPCKEEDTENVRI